MGLKSKYETASQGRIPGQGASRLRSDLSSRYLPGSFPAGQGHRRDGRSGLRGAASRAMTRRPVLEGHRRRNRRQISIEKEDGHQGAGLREGRLPSRQGKGRQEALRRHAGASWRSNNTERIVNVEEDDMMAVVSKWTGVPLPAHGAGRGREAAQDGRGAEEARAVGQDEAVVAISKALRRSPCRPLKDPAPSDWLVHLPWPDRRRKDLPRQEPRRVHVRQRRCAHSDRHVRVHGEAHRLLA